MDTLKQKIEDQEKEQKLSYEKFAQKNKDNEFLTNLRILKFRFYSYKEFLKIFANNFYTDSFSGSRNSFYCLLFLPTFILVGFNLLNPFSIFKRIAITSSLGGSMISFYFCMKDELSDLAKKDTLLGAQIRDRFQQLAVYDPLIMSFKEETQKYQKESSISKQ